MNGSKAARWTRIRDRAQQSWPALSNTAYGAVAAACSRSASAKTTFALLPPSSSVTGLTCRAQPAMICWPTSVEPVKTILAHVGVVDEPLPDHAALARQHLEHVLRQPGLQGELGEPQRGQRGQLGRLEHDRVAGGERGREAPGRDRHREVPRHDHADHAERLVEGDVEAAGHRDLLADQPLRRRRVVGQHVADVAGLPAGVADGVPRVAHLEPGQLLARRRPPRRSGAAAGRGRRARPPATRPTRPTRGRPPRRSPRREAGSTW